MTTPIKISIDSYQDGSAWSRTGVFDQHDVVIEIAGHRFVNSHHSPQRAEKVGYEVAKALGADVPVPRVRGRIISFDENSLRGQVRIAGATYIFHSTMFQSDTAMRWPRVGEAVQVVFTKKGGLLSLHGE